MTNATVQSSPDVALRVAVVNDFEIVVKGLEAMLEPFDDRVVVVESEAGGIPSGAADIALFDTFAGHRTSLARIDAMVEDRSMTKVVLYTWDADGDFADTACHHDIDAVICKSTAGEALVALLERIHRGEQVVVTHAPDDAYRQRSDADDDRLGSLSDREREVLTILAGGASNKEIADELFVSAETIKSHVRSILAKLGAKNRTEAALIAHEVGFDRRSGAD